MHSYFLFVLVFSVEPWQRGNKGIIYPLHLNNSKGKWVQNTTDRIILSDDTLTQITEGTFNFLYESTCLNL